MSEKTTYTSVILKRQVPIRFNETPCSWLGGLPMMPFLKKWPRDKDGAPLHFLAQVCCADLPEGLWNGLGPRKGWLLLFVETLKLDDYSENKTVQVLHTGYLGSERQPPKDTPIVRHVMSDYIDYTNPNIRPGVPKFWRRWPVDIIEQEYRLTDIEAEECGAPSIHAGELYEGTISSKGLYEKPFASDCPITWRGARYVIEGILRDLKPDEFKRNFVGNGGLLDAPEFDRQWCEPAIIERVYQSPEYKGGHVASWGQNSDLYARMEAEIRDERRTGWANRAFQLFDKETARYKEAKAEIEQAEAVGEENPQARIGNVILPIKGVLSSLERVDRYRIALENLIAQYPEPDPEAALTKEIQLLGEAFLEWGTRTATAAQVAMREVDSHDLESFITAQEWASLISDFSESSTECWTKRGDILTKNSRDIRFQKHLDMAIREDVLDLYTCDYETPETLSPDLISDVEEKVKYIEPDLPHRLGGLPNLVQDRPLNQDDQLLFQIGTDMPMGWMWGDVGALYVTIPSKNLKRCRFSRLDAWIDGH